MVFVLEHVHRHAGVPQGSRDSIHLGHRLGRGRLVGLPLRDLALKRVVGRGSRIGDEPLTTDQDDGGRGLGTHVRNLLS